jgi:hypothetical protein
MRDPNRVGWIDFIDHRLYSVLKNSFSVLYMLCSLYALGSNVGSCAQAFGRVDVLCFQICAAGEMVDILDRAHS